MLVSELIELLKQYPGDATVMVESQVGGGYATDVDWVVHCFEPTPPTPFSVVITDYPQGES